MKKFTLILSMTLFVCTVAFSQTHYVAVKSAVLKSSTGIFAGNVGSLSLGDTVTLVSESGKWSQVRAGNLTGWIQSNELSTRRVITTNTTGVSASEVALAGKGFSQENEAELRRGGTNYAMVDAMEQITVPLDNLLRFIDEGRLSRGE